MTEKFSKKELSEADIRTKYITPAIKQAGWDVMTQMREEYTLAPGRLMKKSDTDSTVKKPDYVLFHKPGLPLAVVEAKDNKHTPQDGIQQALTYAKLLNVPFAFSSNGDSFIFHDKTADGDLETSLAMDAFPSPQTLLNKYQQWQGLSGKAAAADLQGYYEGGNQPRYYQQTAINLAVRTIAAGDIVRTGDRQTPPISPDSHML